MALLACSNISQNCIYIVFCFNFSSFIYSNTSLLSYKVPTHKHSFIWYSPLTCIPGNSSHLKVCIVCNVVSTSKFDKQEQKLNVSILSGLNSSSLKFTEGLTKSGHQEAHFFHELIPKLVSCYSLVSLKDCGCVAFQSGKFLIDSCLKIHICGKRACQL